MLEGGSSGCAEFDENHRIVGQLWGDSPLTCINKNFAWFGKFLKSWSGSGTSATRLSDWLGGINNPTTVNTLLMPSILGDEVLCTTSKSFLLENPMPGYTITWAVSPTNLFGSATSGSGAKVTLWASSNSFNGSATLTYTLSSEDCGNFTFTKKIWVGNPKFELEVDHDTGCVGDNFIITIIPKSHIDIHNVQWSFSGSVTGSIHTAYGEATGVHAGVGYICVTITNECGSTQVCIHVLVEDCRRPFIMNSTSNEEVNKIQENHFEKIFAFPNPVDGILTIELNDSFYPTTEFKDIKLLDLNGRVKYKTTSSGNILQINTRDYPSGIFYLEVSYNKNISYHKLIIL